MPQSLKFSAACCCRQRCLLSSQASGLGIGRGLVAVFIGELTGAREGLGYLISVSGQTFNVPAMFVGVLVLGAAGMLNGIAIAWYCRDNGSTNACGNWRKGGCVNWRGGSGIGNSQRMRATNGN